MNKQKALDRIAQEIEQCLECKIGKSGKAVPGEGDPDADIIFMGEAPGKTEAKMGRPFIGRSGQLLRALIREAGLREEDVYITSPVKYLPDRGTPTPKDIAHAKTHLEKQLTVIDPKAIVLLGNVAVQGVLGRKIPVKTDHGKVIEENGRKYLVTLHPAAGLRFPPLKALLIEDFKKVKTLVQDNE
jgi:DNA polymerase